jgi:hypothetical protein
MQLAPQRRRNQDAGVSAIQRNKRARGGGAVVAPSFTPRPTPQVIPRLTPRSTPRGVPLELRCRLVGRRCVLFSGASGEGKWETGQRQGA